MTEMAFSAGMEAHGQQQVCHGCMFHKQGRLSISMRVSCYRTQVSGPSGTDMKHTSNASRRTFTSRHPHRHGQPLQEDMRPNRRPVCEGAWHVRSTSQRHALKSSPSCSFSPSSFAVVCPMRPRRSRSGISLLDWLWRTNRICPPARLVCAPRPGQGVRRAPPWGL